MFCQQLAAVYEAESDLTESSTVESLRVTTRQVQRHRPSSRMIHGMQ